MMNGGSYRANVNDGKAIVVTNANTQLNGVTVMTTDGGGSGSSASTSGAFGVSVSGPAASMTGSNLTIDTMGTGLWVSGGASVTVSNLDLTMRATGTSQGPLGSNAGIWTEGVSNGKASTVSVSDSTITLTGNRTAAAQAPFFPDAQISRSSHEPSGQRKLRKQHKNSDELAAESNIHFQSAMPLRQGETSELLLLDVNLVDSSP